MPGAAKAAPLVQRRSGGHPARHADGARRLGTAGKMPALPPPQHCRL